MRIGCLQFAPQVGDVDNNLNRADAILNRSMPGDLDLLVLPEMAFSGYNFQSLRDISPFLEPTGAGITSVWARTTALKHDCKVVVGYPEKVDVAQKWPTSPEYYNSAIVVNEEGETLGNYRKSHLYYIDETWALEGSGFFKRRLDGIGKVAMGICMDINPYKFEAPWSSFEFAFHVLDVRANVVIISMAWLTRADASTFSCKPKEPDMETMTYWVTRLEPLIRAESEEEIIVIFANRTGVEDEAVYAGTSAVIGVKEGEVTVYGILGRGEKELLVVDTDTPGFAKLVYRPEDLTVPMPRGERRPSSIGSSNESVASGSSDETATTADDVPVITASTTSTTSTTSVTSVTSTTSTATATPVDSDRRSLFGHIFIDTDVVNTPGPKVRQDTPMSPRYYWNRTPAGAPLSSQFPNKGIHESFAEWHEARKSRENTPANRAPYLQSRLSRPTREATINESP
ncbi:carbon-nitrogen hydrolase [Xylariaceae sp. FL0016]|nr:carbon-nitrogen hydrolase [Xylariaceae sp. FL0016]